MNDKLGKTHTFKKYVEDNVLSKINSKQLLLDFIRWKQDEKEKSRIQDIELLKY